MSKQFYFKQSSLVQVRSLNIKTVLFQEIQFSINMISWLVGFYGIGYLMPNPFLYK